MRAKCRYATLDQPFFVACTYRKICERQWGEGMTHANACDTGPELTSSHSEVLSRAAICAVLLAMFTITLGYGIALPILPLLIERDVAGVTAAALSRHTGFLTGAYIMAIFLFAPLWGRASDRWGRRPVMIIGLGGFALASIWMALASSISLLYSARFMAGIFAAAITPVAYAIVGDHAPSREWRARRFAIVNAVGTAGLFIGPVLSGVAFRILNGTSTSSAWTFAAPFLMISGLALAAAWAIYIFAPRTRNVNSNSAAAQTTKYSRWVILRLWIVALATAIAVGSFEVGIALKGKQILAFDAYELGMMFAECSLVMFVVQAVVFSPLVKPDSTRLLIAPALVLLAAGLIGVKFADSYVAMTVVIALIAGSAGILSPIVTYWVSLAAGDSPGAQLGQATAAASLGQAIGSVLGGVLFVSPQAENAPFLVAAVVVLTAFAASIGLPSALLAAVDAKSR